MKQAEAEKEQPRFGVTAPEKWDPFGLEEELQRATRAESEVEETAFTGERYEVTAADGINPLITSDGDAPDR